MIKNVEERKIKNTFGRLCAMKGIFEIEISLLVKEVS
jgi:hypothetical protein